MFLLYRPVGFDGKRAAVHFDHKHVFCESFAEGKNFTLTIQRDAVSVENEFVVRADRVYLDERNLLVAGHALQHFKARPFFSNMPRRG